MGHVRHIGYKFKKYCLRIMRGIYSSAQMTSYGRPCLGSGIMLFVFTCAPDELTVVSMAVFIESEELQHTVELASRLM